MRDARHGRLHLRPAEQRKVSTVSEQDEQIKLVLMLVDTVGDGVRASMAGSLQKMAVVALCDTIRVLLTTSPEGPDVQKVLDPMIDIMRAAR